MAENILCDELKAASEMGIDYENDVPAEAKQNIKKEMRLATEPKKKFSEFIPDSGILRDYFDYACPLTDAPEIWHVITSIAMLGAALRNKVYIQFGPQKIFPNIWMILLAPTSFYRKSTVLSIAKGLLTKIKLHDDRSSLVFPNEFSPEQMITILERQPQGIFVWSEFAGVLSHFERSYMLGIKEFLTEIYDSPPTYTRKIKDNTWTIRDASISIMSASAMEWFNSKVREGDIRGGFLARFLYVPESKKTKRLAIPPEPNTQLANRIVKGIHEVQDTTGKMDITGITDQYSKWIFRHEDELEYEDNNADLLSGFYTRLSVYCLKFAMIIEISKNPSELQISPDSLEKAINITSWLKSNIKRLLGTEFSFSKDMDQKKKIMKQISKNDGIEYRRLLQNSNMHAKDLRIILETLKEEGFAERKNGHIKLINVSKVS